MAQIRVTQQILQFVADSSDDPSVRITQLFAQVAVSNSTNVTKNVAQTMLSQSIDTGNTTYRGVSLTMFDGASDNSWTYDPFFNVFVNQAMLQQTWEPLYFPIAQSMLTVTANPDVEVEVFQYLGFTDRIPVDVANHFGFDGIAREATIATAANYFFTNPDDDNAWIRAYNADNNFSFTLTANVVGEETVSNTFNLADTVTVAASSDFGRSASQMALKQAVSFHITQSTDCIEKQYAPHVGHSDDSTIPVMQSTANSLSEPAETISLTYPRTSPTLTLTLTTPDFGNEAMYSFTKIERETRGGDTKIKVDSAWATWERLRFVSTGNNDGCTSTVEEIITFLNTSLGKKIGLTDHEGRSWEGFIVAPETEVRTETDGVAVELVFEGVLTTYAVQHDLDGVIHGADTVVYEI